jgi:hypothetical protein
LTGSRHSAAYPKIPTELADPAAGSAAREHGIVMPGIDPSSMAVPFKLYSRYMQRKTVVSSRLAALVRRGARSGGGFRVQKAPARFMVG